MMPLAAAITTAVLMGPPVALTTQRYVSDQSSLQATTHGLVSYKLGRLSMVRSSPAFLFRYNSYP